MPDTSHPILHIQEAGAADKFSKKMQQLQHDNSEVLAATTAANTGVSYIDLRRFPIVPEALGMIPEEQARELKVVAFYRDADSFRLAAIDPTDTRVVDLQQELETKFHVKGGMYALSTTSLEKAFALYKAIPKIKEVTRDVSIDEATLAKFREEVQSFDALRAKVQTVNTTDVVALVLASAVNNRASDVHVEAEKEGITIRLRLDGVLQDVATVDASRWKQIISRIKLISGLKINVIDKPQDGRFTIRIDGVEVDVRVSTIPTVFGESVVMRLLRPMTDKITVESMGFAGKALADLTAAMNKPNGMIITTGPTGSGKTTTLYTMLRQLNTSDVKIITLEDPVEYKLEGIAQSQIDASHDYTFAKGLRSILRQDPDIVMVGEIRDLETAEVAIQAALTGHLMLSTIHTNSAPGAIPRFLSMGVKPFLLAPALSVIMGQRLARKLCEKCKVPAVPDAAQLAQAQELVAAISPKSGVVVDLSKATWMGPKGCDACGNLGFKGRIGIFEVLVMSDAIKDIMGTADVPEHHVLRVAVEEGMVPMITDGIIKASQGITTIDEVLRVAA